MGATCEFFSVKTLNKTFGGLQAIKDLDFEITEGKITGLIGPNGAGKTTAFNLICGIIPIDSGEITFLGKRIDGMKPYQIASLGIARTFQTLNNFPRLSVFENIRSGIISRALPEKEEVRKVNEIMDSLKISHLSQMIVTEIPPVARRLVEVGRAIISDPKLVLFDEIMAGFNEEEVVNLISIIRNENTRGMSFLIIGHTMRAIMQISDHIIVMRNGSVFTSGRPSEIQKNKEVQRIYLGE